MLKVNRGTEVEALSRTDSFGMAGFSVGIRNL
jgi:hypothetical protein